MFLLWWSCILFICFRFFYLLSLLFSRVIEIYLVVVWGSPLGLQNDLLIFLLILFLPYSFSFCYHFSYVSYEYFCNFCLFTPCFNLCIFWPCLVRGNFFNKLCCNNSYYRCIDLKWERCWNKNTTRKCSQMILYQRNDIKIDWPLSLLLL